MANAETPAGGFLENRAMSTRLQISDQNDNLLTVQVSMDFGLKLVGTWMPDYPGKVKSSSNWSDNTWDSAVTATKSSFRDAICYTKDSSGSRILVMTFNGAFYRGPLPGTMFLKAGSGFIFDSGNLTMATGVFTWTNLDATTSDSADDGSDSDSDGSDDDSSVSDSAYA
jgi:hypothetical protein